MLNALFDIDDLLPFIASGHQILTPNRRLAAKISDAFNQQQQAEGLISWPVAAIDSHDDVVLHHWQQCLVG